MPIWLHDVAEALRTTREPGQVFSAVAAHARALGFEHCAYGVRLPLPLAQPRVVMINDYPEAWRSRYLECHYLEIDPTVARGLASCEPMLWNDALFAPTPQLWSEARAQGLRHGWAQSVRSARGVIGMLSLSRSAEVITPQELRCTEPNLVWLAQCAHEAFARLDEVAEGPAPPALTAREAAVLRWSADGKTASEVAEILHLSLRAVHFHIANAMHKLGAPNKTAAVVRALMLELL